MTHPVKPMKQTKIQRPTDNGNGNMINDNVPCATYMSPFISALG